jgi:hypothetical protein
LFANATGIPLTTGVTGILPAANGGTGVANASTLTLAGNVTHAGAFTQTFTATANTSLTLPVTGTLATLAGTEALSNKTITASPISGSTGAFTTLSATTGTFSGEILGGTGSAGTQIYVKTATAGKSAARFEGVAGQLWVDLSGAGVNYHDAATHRFRTYAGGQIADFSSTGLAVTGFITATSYLSIIANASAENILIRGRSADNYGSIKFQSNSGLTRYGYIQSHSDFGGTLAIVADGGSRIDLDNRGILMNNSLAVTGALSSTTGANFATSSGNVGIGTTSPGARLTVIGSAAKLYVDLSGENYYDAASHIFRNFAGTERARIDSSGNVGIGTTSPLGKLDVLFGGNTDPAGLGDVSIQALRLASSGIAAISVRQYDAGNQPAAGDLQFLNLYYNGSTYNYYERMRIKANGNIKFNAYGAGALTTDASGNITASSDERIKSNIRPFSRGLAEILAINPILHGYTEESGLDQSRDDYAGFSAQQVQTIIPEAIGANADGMLSFSDRPVMAALVNAMKELNANLVAELQSVRQRLAALEA